MGFSGTETIHIAMFPWFAFGHISPFIELSNKLTSVDPTIKITFLSAPSIIPRISSSLVSTAQIIPVQIPPIDGIPPGVESTADMTPHQAELLKKAVDNMKPQMETLLAHLRPHIIFHDFTHQWLPSIATPLNIRTIFLIVFSAIGSAYVLAPARLASSQDTPTIPQNYQNIPLVENLKHPPPGFPRTAFTSLKEFEARELVYAFLSFCGPSVYDRCVACINNSSATVLKASMEMEGPYVKYIQSHYKKPVLLCGPLVPQPPTDALDQRWADWLGRFPSKSVVFCSFGSETFLQDDQIRELLLGLEMAGPPFLVVLNFTGGEETAARLKEILPEGFQERVKDKGVVHTGWVQQRRILAHDSVGCYVCHAGYSSITEALVADCQLVLLPQKADQVFNGKLLDGDLKAGIEVKRDDESGYFGKEDLCEAVKAVMERVEEETGKTVRKNQAKWRDYLRDANASEKIFMDFVEEMKGLLYSA